MVVEESWSYLNWKLTTTRLASEILTASIKWTNPWELWQFLVTRRHRITKSSAF